MPRSGRRWPSPLGDSRRAWELLHDQPGEPCEVSEGIATYKVEPYVVAADVYALSPHTGRGGWTWYTGSAGWMYRLIVESLLGLRLEVDKLRLHPSFRRIGGVQGALPVPGNGLPHRRSADMAMRRV